MAKAEVSTAFGVIAVKDDKVKKAKKEKKGGNEIENPSNAGSRHRQIGLSTKAGTRETML